MIEWWLFPLLITIAAGFLVSMVASDCNVPYRGFMLVAVLVILLPLIALMWLFAFLIAMAHP